MEKKGNAQSVRSVSLTSAPSLSEATGSLSCIPLRASIHMLLRSAAKHVGEPSCQLHNDPAASKEKGEEEKRN